jgi:hypothetical protein
MCQRIVLFCLVLALFSISSVHAANIVWISEIMDETVDGVQDGIQDDQQWVDILRDYGHEVYTNPGGWADLDPNEIELMNNADLVIFGRSTNSGGYAGDTAEVTTWNSITTPLILMNAYLLRSNRWRCMNTTVMGGLETAGLSTYYPASVEMEVVDLSHPMFTGIQLDENNRFHALDPNADSGNFSIIGSNDVGNGTLIAKPADRDWAFIAEWQAGVETYPGSGQIFADKRLYFACGAQAVTDGYGGAYNLTEEGLKLFLNAVDYMLGVGPQFKAHVPQPADGQKEVLRDTVLEWKPGVLAEKHDVYFGTDRKAVNNADRDNPIDALVAQDQIETSYAPAALLDYGQTYYWRVDEISGSDANSPWKGDLWSFTVLNFIIVEDFESYNNLNPDEEGSRRIYTIWLDGFDNPAVNGSTMGYPDPSLANGESFVETEIVHGGSQSAPIFFDNTTASYSEVSVSTDELSIGRDWTVDAPERLSLWVYGDPNNSGTEQMYVKVNGAKVTVDADLTLADWQEVSVNLADFGTNLTNVTTLSIGFDRTGATGGTGKVFVDDIRLYRPAVPMPLAVENYSFELPGTVKMKNWEDVPGWSSDTVATDSGVESAGPRFPPSDGLWSGFLKGDDPSVWQLTNHIIKAGAQYILTVDAENNSGANQLLMSLYYDDGSGNRIVAASQTVDLLDANNASDHNTQDKVEFTLTFSADDVPEAVGHNLGIEFDNPAGGYLGLDNVGLSIL